ncbi:MAG TPA: cytochrome c oxidase subunit II [Dehalococcoidia bacterium]|nr:cytochrome c oxidase subunit II [Dehalococcoidia bacterium]
MFNTIKKFLPILLSLLFVVACGGYDGPQSTFDTHGPVAKEQADLFYLILWAGMVVLVAVELAIIYIYIKYRRKKNSARVPSQTHGNTKLEIMWTILPAIFLAIVSVPVLSAIWTIGALPKNPDVVVNVHGHQYWFEFKYQDLDVVTANELHIPVGKKILINLYSNNVLHSFWIPKIAGKTDIIPNQGNYMWIQGDDVGMYYGQCAEFCGESHALMRFRVIVDTDEDFRAWIAHQKSEAFVPNDPLEKSGYDIFMSSKAGCGGCHMINGSKKAKGKIGPNLTHFGSRQHMAAGILENNQVNLRNWIRNPDMIKPGNIMSGQAAVYMDPNKSLTESEVIALASYLQSLK